MTGIDCPLVEEEQRPLESVSVVPLCCSCAGVEGVVLPCASTTPPHASTIARAMASTRTIRLMRAPPLLPRRRKQSPRSRRLGRLPDRRMRSPPPRAPRSPSSSPAVMLFSSFSFSKLHLDFSPKLLSIATREAYGGKCPRVMGARPISTGRSSRYVPVLGRFGRMVRCSPLEKEKSV